MVGSVACAAGLFLAAFVHRAPSGRARRTGFSHSFDCGNVHGSRGAVDFGNSDRLPWRPGDANELFLGQLNARLAVMPITFREGGIG